MIRIQNLSVHYGSFCALSAAEVQLQEGSVGLLGPNGAGKSTLLKVILGLVRQSSGRAQIFGLDMNRDSLAIRGRVGYMPENDSFVPGLTAVQFVTLAGELAGMPWRDAMRRAHESLYYVGLEEARYRRIEEYSTGMKQRFKLAQALVHDPDLLILDEPTSGLDPTSRRSMLELIRSLHVDFHKSILLSTHILEDVDKVCDSLVILNQGKVAASGRIDELRVHWKNRYRLQVEGDWKTYLAALQAAGAELLAVEAGGNGGDGEIIVEAPEGWLGRRFFEIIASLEDGASAGSAGQITSPIRLRSMRLDHERLDHLFQRLLGGGKEAPR